MNEEMISKFKLNTFSYFSNIFLNCINLETFNLNLISYISFFKNICNSNSLYTSITNTFIKFNLLMKNYS